MKIKITADQYSSMMGGLGHPGVCLSCGDLDEYASVEPDASGRVCPACDAPSLCGLSFALESGHLDFIEPEPEPEPESKSCLKPDNILLVRAFVRHAVSHRIGKCDHCNSFGCDFRSATVITFDKASSSYLTCTRCIEKMRASKPGEASTLQRIKKWADGNGDTMELWSASGIEVVS